jgi:CDP-glucose 4,6-dehydratase
MIKSWKNVKVLTTGGLGFKGSWLAVILKNLGAKIYDISLSSNFYDPGNEINKCFEITHDFDISDFDQTLKFLEKVEPDVVIHFAAQPIVSIGFERPLLTHRSNVIGTLNLLELVRRSNSVKSFLICTTDKVYRNLENRELFPETAALGSLDPYSASKAAADLLAQSYMKYFLPGVATHIVRAGNVFGGGDQSKNRLIPDIVRAKLDGMEFCVRNPQAIRPWQHVLDCLGAYLTILNEIPASDNNSFNVGPDQDSILSVQQIVQFMLGGSHVNDSNSKFDEHNFLMLDNSKLKEMTSWRPKLSIQEGLEWTLEWENEVRKGRCVVELCSHQWEKYNAI